MITSGIIKEINISKGNNECNTYKVELNMLQSAGDTNTSHYTYIATCCTVGGIFQSYRVDDIVYVGFFENQLGKPVILGKIYKGITDDFNSLAQLETLRVLGATELSEDTKIGDISYNDLTTIKQLIFNLTAKTDLPKVTNLAYNHQYKLKITLPNDNTFYSKCCINSTSAETSTSINDFTSAVRLTFGDTKVTLTLCTIDDSIDINYPFSAADLIVLNNANMQSLIFIIIYNETTNDTNIVARAVYDVSGTIEIIDDKILNI